MIILLYVVCCWMKVIWSDLRSNLRLGVEKIANEGKRVEIAEIPLSSSTIASHLGRLGKKTMVKEVRRQNLANVSSHGEALASDLKKKGLNGLPP